MKNNAMGEPFQSASVRHEKYTEILKSVDVD